MQYRGRMDSRPHTLQDALCHYSIHTSSLQPSNKREGLSLLTLWAVMTHLLLGNLRAYSREAFLHLVLSGGIAGICSPLAHRYSFSPSEKWKYTFRRGTNFSGC